MSFLSQDFIENFKSGSHINTDSFYEAWTGPMDEDGFILFEDSDKALKEDLGVTETTLQFFMRDFDKGNVEVSEDEGDRWMPFI